MAAKRAFDILFASICLVLSAPLLLAVAIAVRFDSAGPALYRSPRVGKNGKTFGMLRFRTVDLRRPDSWPMDRRLTRAGRIIRNFSLDDLPNLFNILAGEMSVVGPRPTEPESVDVRDPAWREILTVRPGWFSYAILTLARQFNASGWDVKKRLELEYVRSRSFGYDLRLLGRTFWAHIVSLGNIKARGKQSL